MFLIFKYNQSSQHSLEPLGVPELDVMYNDKKYNTLQLYWRRPVHLNDNMVQYNVWWIFFSSLFGFL